MNGYLKRIEALKARADQMAAAYRKRQQDALPFCEIIIDEIMGDGKAVVISHPHGHSGKSHQWSGTLKAAFAWADKEKIDTYANMIYCPLWSHVFYQRSPLYTDAQKAMFLEQDRQKYPEVSQLYDRDDKDAMIDFIAGLPQFCYWPAQDRG